MEGPIVGAVLVAILIAVILLLVTRDQSLGYVLSKHDGERYIVYRNMSQNQEAAYAMSIINSRITALSAYLKRTAPNDRVTRAILGNYNPDKLAEITASNAFGYTSYTVDRGRSMRFCLRNKTTMGVHEIDELTFVAYHELAHIGDWDSDHNLPFWQVFKYLLQCAVRAGIYTPTDYSKRPMTYCGMDVEYNPYFDTALDAYAPRQ